MLQGSKTNLPGKERLSAGKPKTFKPSRHPESDADMLARAEIAFDNEDSLGVEQSRKYLDSILNAGS